MLQIPFYPVFIRVFVVTIESYNVYNVTNRTETFRFRNNPIKGIFVTLFRTLFGAHTLLQTAGFYSTFSTLAFYPESH